jgi:NO-binding membrane sensor protein with MHYT domain
MLTRHDVPKAGLGEQSRATFMEVVGGLWLMAVYNFSYGLLTPVLGYVMSCLGWFLGLRCTTRARAAQGYARARWLLLAAVSIAVAGVWGMHFIAMLGFGIPGQVVRYSVPVTIFSMLIAVAVVSVGVLIVGFGGAGMVPLLAGSVIIGLGVAGMHYIGMSAMRMPDTMHYRMGLVIFSVIIAVITGAAALWAARRLDSMWSALVASLILGVGVSAMHYTGMAALRVHADLAARGMTGGASASSFLGPLIFGVAVLTMVLTAAISLSPTEADLRKENESIERLTREYSGRSGREPGDP